MKSKRAKEGIVRYYKEFSPYNIEETMEYCRLFEEIAEIAEQEAEEQMSEKAHKIILDMMMGIFHGDMPRKIADEFIQKLLDDETN